MKPKGTMSFIDHAAPSPVKVDKVSLNGTDNSKYLDIICKRLADLCDVVSEKEFDKAEPLSLDIAVDSICHDIHDAADMICKSMAAIELKFPKIEPKIDLQVRDINMTLPKKAWLLVAVPILYAMAINGWLVLHH